MCGEVTSLWQAVDNRFLRCKEAVTTVALVRSGESGLAADLSARPLILAVRPRPAWRGAEPGLRTEERGGRAAVHPTPLKLTPFLLLQRHCLSSNRKERQ